MRMIRMFAKVARNTQLGNVSLAYLAIFVICAAVIGAISPEVGGFGNALWLCFQTATTIGFGDTYTYNAIVRILLVVVSVLSLFYLALVTGAFVAMCQETVKATNKESLSHFMDELENLEHKTPAELADISQRVRKFKLK